MSEVFLLGALDVFKAKDSEDLIIIGRGTGKVERGTAIYIANPGSDDDAQFLSVVSDIQVTNGEEWESVEEAKDRVMALRIERGTQYPYAKRTSVVYTREATVKEVHDAYITAMGDAYIIKAELVISEEEMNRMSLTDLAELWRMNSWYHATVRKGEPEEDKQLNLSRLNKVCETLCRKIREADSFYCVYSKLTGEPYMFSRTVKKDEGYVCTPPNIRIIPKAYYSVYKDTYTTDKLELKLIENGEERKEICNFLGDSFYLNGAMGVEIITEMTPVDAGALVKAPEKTDAPIVTVPVTNPDVMRWVLLLGQIGTPKNDDEKLIFNLYYSFFARAAKDARFLVPMKKAEEKEIATQPGKNGRTAVKMFTDWRRFKALYDEEWGGLIQTMGNVIETFDIAINPGSFPGLGGYIEADMYEQMKLIDKPKAE